MSYDLIGYRAQPGENPEQALERLETLAEDDTPPSPSEWEEMVRIGDRLAEVAPGAERHEQRDDGFVELTTDRFQVSLHRDEAALSVPYWTDGSDEPWPVVTACLEVLRASGFTVFDPQTEELIGDDVAAQVAASYRMSAAQVLPVLDQAARSAPSPRRRRFFGRRKKDD